MTDPRGKLKKAPERPEGAAGRKWVGEASQGQAGLGRILATCTLTSQMQTAYIVFPLGGEMCISDVPTLPSLEQAESCTWTLSLAAPHSRPPIS